MARLLTSDELAELLRYSERGIRRLAKLGRLPSVQLFPRAKLLFDAEAVQKLLRESQPPRPAGADPKKE
jgi:excisionase family DNA binding protein